MNLLEHRHVSFDDAILETVIEAGEVLSERELAVYE
jgi:hypothetical protein